MLYLSYRVPLLITQILQNFQNNTKSSYTFFIQIKNTLRLRTLIKYLSYRNIKYMYWYVFDTPFLKYLEKTIKARCCNKAKCY